MDLPTGMDLPYRIVEGDKISVMHIKNMLGKTVWVISASGTGKPIYGIAFAQGPACMWWVMQKDDDIWCVPQGLGSVGTANNLNRMLLTAT